MVYQPVAYHHPCLVSGHHAPIATLNLGKRIPFEVVWWWAGKEAFVVTRVGSRNLNKHLAWIAPANKVPFCFAGNKSRPIVVTCIEWLLSLADLDTYSMAHCDAGYPAAPSAWACAQLHALCNATAQPMRYPRSLQQRRSSNAPPKPALKVMGRTSSCGI